MSATYAAAQTKKPRTERYEIEIAFEPERGFLRAKASVTLRTAEPTETIEFELNPGLEIQGITDAQGHKLAFDRSRRLGSPRLLVRLVEPCVADQGITLTFNYEGVPRLSGLDYITKDGILLRDEARWYPAVDLAAFTQNDITIRLPAVWTAVTSGQRQQIPSRREASTTRRWITTRPVSSRSLFAIPGTLHCIKPVKELTTERTFAHEVSVCAPASQTGPLVDIAYHAARIFEHYARMLGPDRSGEFQAVQGFPGQRGAIGYSAPCFLVVSEDVVKNFGYPGYVPEFLPHEIAHQWFPIEVTLAREEDGWLAESLAEYLAWRYLAEKDPERARAMVARAMRDALVPDPPRPLSLGLRLFGLEDWEVTHATLYQRGMLVFRTLETVIGRSRVNAALREYYKRFAGRAASIADFRKVCEEISGRDLGWFFDYFLNGTEIPEIELRRVPATAPGEFAGEIVVRNVPADFSVRVEMRLQTTPSAPLGTGAGPLDHSVATRGEVTPFTVTTPNPVASFTLDPDARILRWTEAARRHRAQRRLLAQLGELERTGQFDTALRVGEEALALDPDNLAANHQPIHFAMGRLRYRLGQFVQARETFARVLALGSLDPMDADFFRAWARVYRARIERRRGNFTGAHTEARAGLATPSPALHTPVAWPETPQRESTAYNELRALARQGPAPQ